MSTPRARPLVVARAGFGLVLVAAPERLLRRLPHRHVDHPADLVARVLGARHLLEALLLGERHQRRWIAVSVAIDSIHAATAFGFGALDERHRRLAWTNGLTATVLALEGLRELYADA